MRTCIQNVILMPGVTNEAHLPFIMNAEIHIVNEMIVYAGKAEQAPAFEADKTIDGRGAVAMPGLINMHTHTPMISMRNTGNDMPLADWLTKAVFPVEHHWDDAGVLAASYLGIMEMLRFGTTCFNDMYMRMDMEAKAVEETGIRAMLGYGIVDFDSVCRDFEPGIELVEKWNHKADDRIRISIDPHAENTTTPAVLEKVRKASLEYKVPVHIHVCETKPEVDGCLQRRGMTPPQYFESIGLLDCPTIAAHCVWMTDDDIDLFAKRGVTIVHNPMSNCKLASGIAPVQKMLERGCRVTIGTDGVASNNSLNLWEEIKMMPMLQKVSLLDAAVVSPAQVIAAATSNAAEALGYENLGFVKEGYLADLILVDLNVPNSTSTNDLETNLIYSTQGSDVCMTMVHGKVLYENGRYTTLDAEKVMRDAKRETELLYERTSAAK